MPPSPPRIAVIGLNPTYELTYEVAALKPGVLTATRFARTFAGKGTTVARVLVTLGNEPLLITPLPQGVDALDLTGIDVYGTPTTAAPRFSVVLAETSGPKRFVVRHPGTQLPPTEAASLDQSLIATALQVLRPCHTLVLAGSRLPGLSVDVVDRLLLAGHACHHKVLDVIGDNLLTALRHRPTIAKLNEHEFCNTFNVTAARALPAKARAIASETGAAIVVTRGPEPVKVFLPDQPDARIRILKAHPTMRFAGAGDAMTAALASALHRGGMDLSSCVLFATGVGVVAAGAFGSGNLTSPLPESAGLVAYE